MVCGYSLFVAVVAALSVILAWLFVPQVMAGQLYGTDSYMRLVRVEHLVETSGWYDSVIPRSNAPNGEVLHWTRPMDALLLAGTAVFRPFLPFRDALYFSAVCLPPFLLLLICFATAWAALPLAGPRYRFYAMAAVLAQLAVVGYGFPGRPDHHLLFLLCFILSFGFFVRGLMPPLHRGMALAAGAAAGVGIWNGPEALIPLALILGTGTLLWIRWGGGLARWNLWLASGLAGSVVLALVMERPPSAITVVEYDRISLVHVLVGQLALGFWMVVPGLEAWRGKPPSWARRLLAALVGAGAATAVLFAAYPKFFKGPTVDVDPRIETIWLQNVMEYLPLMESASLADLGRAVALLGPVLFCLPFLIRVLTMEKGSEAWGAWLLLAISMVAFLPLGILHFRFVAYPELLIVLVTVAILPRIRAKLTPIRSGFLRSAAWSLSCGLLIGGCLLVGWGMMVSGGRFGRGGGGLQRAREVCDVSDLALLAPILTDPTGLGDRTRTILAPMDLGPRLLYTTRHQVLATPYHRNAEGILGAAQILVSQNTTESRTLIREREVDLLLLCPISDSPGRSVLGDESNPRRFYDRVWDGDDLPWIERVPLPENLPGAFRLYQVVDPTS